MEKNKTVIIVVGPTAVGKTAFAIQLASALQTEIISADSRQCYREMNIGVARPTPGELQQIPHHFISSHSIYNEVNAAVFADYALAAVDSIFKQHDFAVMVGGTGLYVKAFAEGLDEMPGIDENIRQEIVEAYRRNGLEWLQREVATKDPAFWAIAEQQNPQRLMRALEVKQATGRSITEFRKGEAVERPFRIIKIGLELPREELYQRINARVDQMVAAGLLEEARGLFALRQLPALQTVGYRELFAHFEGSLSLEQAISEIKKNSRHYAKRQLTWFKRDPSVRWYHAGTDPRELLPGFVAD